MNKFQFRIRKVVTALTVFNTLFVLTFTSGCEPLRKKFIREQKKDRVSKIAPVLDPINYETTVQTPMEHYAEHYSLWKVWQRDFLDITNNATSDKRQKYVLDQASVQLQEMKKWLGPENQKRFDYFISELNEIRAEFEKPAALRNLFSIRKRFEFVTKEVQRLYKPKLMEGQFIEHD